MKRTFLASALAGALTLTLSACGGGSGSSATGEGGGATADVDAARQLIADYLDAPSAFPVTTPLKSSPAGKRIAYMDCGTPVCSLLYELAKAPADKLGMQLTRIDTGLAADTVATGFDTVIAGHFDGVIVTAIPPQLWESGLAALHEAGIPVVTTGVVGGESDRMAVRQTSEVQTSLAGRLLAGYVVAENGGKTDVVVYTTPELPFTKVMSEAFADEVSKLCPGCAVRTAQIPAATFGTRAASVVVDDLQAHPSTATAVFSIGEQAAGLPTALETAGIEMQTIAYGPDPATLEQIKNGDMTAGLGLDVPVLVWTLVDSLARLTTGPEADPGAVRDAPPMQFLTAANLPEHISSGWTGYPDFMERFEALWTAAS